MSAPAPAADALASRAAAWTRYWSQQSAAGAAAGSFADGYGGSQIERWWTDVMAALSGSRAWLDLATGNGALTQLWARTHQDPHARCAAVNIAQISVPWLQSIEAWQAQRIDWLSGVGVESLPLAASSIDVAMSQYGLEYAELPRACAELARVLTPGGAMRAIMHHADGLPTRLANVEVQHIDDLLRPQGLWAAVEALVEPFARSATAAGRANLEGDEHAHALRLAFNREHQRLEDIARSSRCPDVIHESLAVAAKVLQQAAIAGAPQGHALAAQWAHHLRDSRLRLIELCNHALTEAAMRDLQLVVEPHFTDIGAGIVVERGELMGWTFKATRRP